MVYTSFEQLIGNTPMLQLQNLETLQGLQARLLVKLEGFNPAGSAKDRVALAMIRSAEEKGLLKPGGYRAIIVMPDSMSIERRQLIAAYGAQVVLTDGKLGMTGAIAKAEALQKEIPGSIIVGQFENPANPEAHYLATGPEIWADTQGQVDIFVAGVGTGGTITGAGRYLKEKNSAMQIVAVEPAASPLLSKGFAGSHGLQGIGANFIPKVLDTSVYDHIFTVTEEQAYAATRLLAAREGILAGISSGAALHAAIELAKLPENTGKTIVVLLPDTGERYLSTPAFKA